MPIGSGGSGLSAQFGLADETVFGTAVAAAAFYQFNSESLAKKRIVKQGSGLRAGGRFNQASRRIVTAWDIGGDVSIDLPYLGTGKLLKHMLGTPTPVATVLTGSAFKQIHIDGTLNGRSFTAQKGVPRTDGTVEPYTYPGCKFTAWELDCNQNNIASLKLSIDSIDEKTAASGALALQAASYPTTSAFTFKDGAILQGGTVATAAGLTTVTGGTAVAQVRQVTLKGDNKFKSDRWFMGGNGLKSEQLENDFMAYTGTLVAEFSTRALYDLYSADTNLALQLNFTGSLISGVNYNALNWTMPLVRFEDGPSPQVGGPDVVIQTLPFSVLDDDTGTNPRIQAVLINTDTTV